MAIAVTFGVGDRVDTRRLAIAFVGVVLAIAVAGGTIALVMRTTDSSSAPDTTSASVNSGLANAVPVSDGRNGSPLVLVGGVPMFPLPGSGSLATWSDKPVVAQDVPVQSITANGFWMGVDEVQRVFVSIPRTAVEKGSLGLPELKLGEPVNVSGRMAPIPESLSGYGLDEPTRQKLTTASQMLVANSVRRASSPA